MLYLAPFAVVVALEHALVRIVPTEAQERLGWAIAAELAWLKLLMRMIEVDHGRP
jgi:hypothetical protein